MDINDNQQINTFVKGMNTDVSDSLMDSSQYRYAENVRIATNKDENSGELRLIEGTQFYDEIADTYGEIIAMTSVRSLLIVVTKKGNTNYILVRDTDNSKNVWKIVFKSKEGEELFGGHISLVTRWENKNAIKLYIADNTHGLSYINLATGDYAQADDGNEADDTIEGFENIEANANVSLYRIEAKISATGGTLPPVKLQYAYRLFKEGGASTSISPLSNMIVLYDGDKGFDTTTTSSGKAVDITISQKDSTDLDKMQVYRLAYKQVGQTPEVDLIYEGEFKTSITDTGTNVPSSMSFEEFESMLYYNATPTIIESKGDYMFAANVKYEKDETDIQLKGLDGNFRLYSSGDYDSNNNVLDYNKQFDDSTSYLNYDHNNWKTETPEHGIVIGGSGDYMWWELDIKPLYVTDKNEKYKSFVGGVLSDRTFDQSCSLRQGEVYRYGVIWYNDKGQKSSVYWLCDIMAPDLSGDGASDFRTFTDQNGKTVYRIPIIGVKFHVTGYPDGFSAAEIVRVTREQKDKINVLQGIMGFPYKLRKKEQESDSRNDVDYKDYNDICAPYFPSVNHFKFDPTTEANNHNAMSKAESDNQRLVFACPEYAYQPTDIKNLNLNQSPIQIKPVRTLVKNAHIDITGSSSLVRVSDQSNTWETSQENSEYVWNYNFNSAAPTLTGLSSGEMHNYSVLILGAHPNIIYTHNSPNVSLTVLDYQVALRSIDQENANGKKVNNVSFTEVPDYKDFLNDNGKVNYSSSRTPLGTKSYINWSVPLVYGISEDTISNVYKIPEDDDNAPFYLRVADIDNNWPSVTPTGSTGRYILMDLSNNESFNYISDNSAIYAYIANIQNQNPKPYGGASTIGYSSYMQHGNYIKGTGEIEVFDGDCYPGVFEFNACHAWYNSGAHNTHTTEKYINAIRQASVCYAPIESDIDLSATYGSLYSRMVSGGSQKAYYFQDIKSNFDGYAQDDVRNGDAYLYNTAYGMYYDILPDQAITYSSVSSNEFDCRIYHSEVKTNGELIDNWLIYRPVTTNYIDVDSRFGQITNLRLFKDKLLFWQEHAVGILSVNERTVLNDTNSNEILIGTGGVLSRYDYISTKYGMKSYQYEAEVQSNYVQYWWDGYNKEILAYSGGMELVPLTKVKGLTNYINERTESSHPMLAYDSRYDELLAQVVNKDNVGETLVYNEQIQGFQSVYTFNPLYRTNIGNQLFLSDNKKIYIQNKQDNENYSLLFGNPAFPKVRVVVNKNNTYNKTFDNVTFGGRMYKGSFIPQFQNWPMENSDGYYIKDKDHMNSPMHHLKLSFTTPLKQESSIRGDKAIGVNEYDFRLAIPRDGSTIGGKNVEYGNRMRGKTMQCEIASDYNSTDFSLQYITTKFRMSWS